MKNQKTFRSVTMKTLTFFFLLLVTTNFVLAQNTGTISGTIKDKSTKEVLIGVNVLVQGTKTGANSDFDGKYAIRNLSAGIYSLKFSFVGFTTTTLTDIKVETGKTTELNIALAPENIEQKEVVVEAKAMVQTEAAIINQRKKSYAIADGISQEQLRKTTDATSGDALRRVVGISLIDNKFVNVRGINERYNTTMLNNVPVTSSEPDKKAFSFDMIPSALLENTMVSKSFLPNLPGDFSGGLVQINTVDFPSHLNMRATLSNAFNTVSSLKPFETNEGHSNDYLAISSQSNLPSTFPQTCIDTIAAKSSKYALGKSLANSWNSNTIKSPLNGNYSFSIGNSYQLNDNEFGFIAAASYRNVFSNTKIERNDWATFDNLQGKPTYEQRHAYKGNKYSSDVLWGGVFNMNYKFSELYTMSFKSLYNRTGSDEVTSLHGEEYTNAQEQLHTYQQTTLRSVTSAQVNGELLLPSLNHTNIQWRAFTSVSTRNEPDYRRLIYERPIGSNDPYRAKLSVAFPQLDVSRFFSNLKDNGNGFGMDVTLPVNDANIKTGFLFDTKERTFQARFFGYFFDSFSNFNFNDSMQQLSPQLLFQAENIGVGKLGFDEIFSGSNKYTANHEIVATYAMAEVPFNISEERFRFIGGARIEHSIQQLKTRSQDNVTEIKSNLDNSDVLPSVNLVYAVKENINMKVAYSQTIARPEFRELAAFSFYDFTTNQLVFGNPNLKRTLVTNFDWRVEVFPQLGEILSATVFYKSFDNAIEAVNINSSSNNLMTFANASRAKNYGVEIEARKSFAFLDSSLHNFSVGGNYSRIYSEVEIPKGQGQLAETRPLQGQSPYLINIGLFYATDDNDFSVNVFYNKFGRRIAEAGVKTDINLERVDIYEEAFDQLDVTISKNFTKTISAKFSANNILNQSRKFSYGEKIQKLDIKGISYGLGITFNL